MCLLAFYSSVYNERNCTFVSTSTLRMYAMVNITVEKSGRDYQRKKWHIWHLLVSNALI